ncbi:hypothetical protein [Novosphingobium sp. KN65.2]|uniref:hypothetical protein n=1 Tax=Novosphingobium sp. KN65.2 TaxID=1478134 RepID=UPI0005E40BA6|nr:hypothetical protein [Novosphingobium sp. KN65.2]CDO36083.1 exported hypothetical protein [Novosphingobium sp. KN65.2]
MMHRHLKFWTALSIAGAAALSLGGCKDDASAPKEAAGDKLLPRSVTDDMLPYDTVRSQSPLANPEAAASGDSNAKPTTSDATAAADEAQVAAQEATAAEAAEPAGQAD